MGITADFSNASAPVESVDPDYGVLETYNYVQGDTGPQIRLTFTDEDTGGPTDLTNATVTLYVRPKGEQYAVVVRPLYVNPELATQGQAIIAWQEGDLDLAPGTYEGEVTVERASGVRETLFDVLLFNIRGDFTA